MEALQEASVHPGKPSGKIPPALSGLHPRPHPALSAADVSARTEVPPPRAPHCSSSSSAAAAAAARCFDLDFALGFQGMCGDPPPPLCGTQSFRLPLLEQPRPRCISLNGEHKLTVRERTGKKVWIFMAVLRVFHHQSSVSVL